MLRLESLMRAVVVVVVVTDGNDKPRVWRGRTRRTNRTSRGVEGGREGREGLGVVMTDYESVRYGQLTDSATNE